MDPRLDGGVDLDLAARVRLLDQGTAPAAGIT
jgi:hypothetical protein